MPPSLSEIESAINEAEFVRSRHDGVHTLHSCVTVLQFCLSLARTGEWTPSVDVGFRDTLSTIRSIDRTGFPKRRWEAMATL